ncbi:YbhB/YbcL family Raf kinase inhibitor-like protein [Methylophaga sp. OBS4]|uniref:YbhB/YbcL family Raf kinase inhibitor-like protein n=1 Tax=Methylophaga sp. OBS4 TaxID=2991935 RepID=UPI002254716B|nr:YbhB/YbcL family Raf kinase inhibitor-like protein [Methylophaga sp. OBS4]MCX4186229.1 YbhB/YbcL family Raf kinase inhibitor-like protein [Methylophaga sp. OBS4]
MSFSLKSSTFTHEAQMPALYTCEGKDISPPLSWQDVPEGTRSLVLIVDDPDAPDPRAPKMTWVHWVIYNLPVDIAELAEGASPDNLPPGTQEGINDWKRTGYGGPCPPVGNHRYFHKLYALDMLLNFRGSPDKPAVEAAMDGHILEQATLIGYYQKSG